jgi:hypothetical protein
MKKLIVIVVAFFLTYCIASAQVRFDIKFGISPGSNPLNAGIIVNRQNPMEEFQFNLFQVKPQFYGGLSAHLPLASPFFVNGGITYSQKTSLYQINYTNKSLSSEIKAAEQYMNESENMILLPVNVGVSLGKVDVTSGLTATATFSKSSELTHVNGFTQDENGLQLGWQFGVRYAIRRTMVGVEYQSAFNRVGQGMYVNGHSLELMNVPGKFVFSVQYGF